MRSGRRILAPCCSSLLVFTLLSVAVVQVRFGHEYSTLGRKLPRNQGTHTDYLVNQVDVPSTTEGSGRTLSDVDDVTGGADGKLKREIRGNVGGESSVLKKAGGRALARLDNSADSTSRSNQPTCVNTIQGRDLVTDNHGFICSRREVTMQDGCCPSVGPRFTCQGCNQTSKCCSIYEHCVACCQDPQNTPAELASEIVRASQPSSIKYGSVFEYCRGQCRHSSRSVVHENSYGSEQHHCYQLPPPAPPPPPPQDEDSLEGLTIVVGSPGQSCDTACSTSRHEIGGSRCNEKKLRALNKCQVLQKYFACRGACVGSVGPDQPAEVVVTAPRHLHPGACLYSVKDNLFSCAGAHLYTRRLCPCMPLGN